MKWGAVTCDSDSLRASLKRGVAVALAKTVPSRAALATTGSAQLSQDGQG